MGWIQLATQASCVAATIAATSGESCRTMPDAIRHFRARLLTPDALVAEWLAAAGDIAEAYVGATGAAMIQPTIGGS